MSLIRLLTFNFQWKRHYTINNPMWLWWLHVSHKPFDSPLRVWLLSRQPLLCVYRSSRLKLLTGAKLRCAVKDSLMLNEYMIAEALLGFTPRLAKSMYKFNTKPFPLRSSRRHFALTWRHISRCLVSLSRLLWKLQRDLMLAFKYKFIQQKLKYA